MPCPSGQGDAPQALERTTAMGYRLDQCRRCRRTLNERTGRAFQSSARPHGDGAHGRALAATRQTECARPGPDVPAARVHVHAYSNAFPVLTLPHAGGTNTFPDPI